MTAIATGSLLAERREQKPLYFLTVRAAQLTPLVVPTAEVLLQKQMTAERLGT